MTFARYPTYAPRHLEWHDEEVPTHWPLTRTKYVCDFVVGWTPPTGNNLSYVGDNLWANISDLGPKLLLDTAKRISDTAIQSARISRVPKGSLLFSFKLSIGQVSIAGTDLYTNEAIAAFLPSERLVISFAYYAFPIFLTYNATENIYGAKLLNQDLIRNAGFPLPPLAEQIAIANFLDHETAKIDALIFEQQRLIDLIKEKRQAIVLHLVTKGLNGGDAMKPSGVEWLGDMPSNWQLMRIKAVSSFVTSGPRGWSENISEQGAIFVQSGDLNDDMEVSFSESKRVRVVSDSETARTLLRDGDVVVCITGAKTGNVAVCETVPEPAYINQHLCLIRPVKEILPMFLGIWLKSKVGQTYFELSQYGLKQGLGLEDIKETPVFLPSIDEQRSIVAYIEVETERIAHLTSEAELAIGLLEERRKALIVAAVTGQIDVRNMYVKVAA